MRIILSLVFLVGFSGFAQAADEFGARFGGAAPAALEEPASPALVSEGQKLEDIVPAAGEGTPAPHSDIYGPAEYLEYDPEQQQPAEDKITDKTSQPLDP